MSRKTNTCGKLIFSDGLEVDVIGDIKLNDKQFSNIVELVVFDNVGDVNLYDTHDIKITFETTTITDVHILDCKIREVTLPEQVIGRITVSNNVRVTNLSDFVDANTHIEFYQPNEIYDAPCIWLDGYQVSGEDKGTKYTI